MGYFRQMASNMFACLDAPTAVQELEGAKEQELQHDKQITACYRLYEKERSKAENISEQAVRVLEWLDAALRCKDFHWDGDQHEAATYEANKLRRLLEPPT